MVQAVGEFLSSGFGQLTVGLLGTGGVIMLAKVVVPAAFKRLTGNFIRHAMNPKTQDQKERELQSAAVLALVELAEYKYPDRGQGGRRFAYVADFLTRMMPRARAEDVALLIEEAVQAMDDAAKAAIEDAKNPKN